MAKTISFDERTTVLRQPAPTLTLAQASPVGVDAYGRFVAAQASSTGSVPAVAFNLGFISTGAAAFGGGSLIHGYRRGIVTGLSGAGGWLVPGKRVYLDTSAGTMTQTAPSTQGQIVQSLGVAITPDEMFVNVPVEWDIA